MFDLILSTIHKPKKWVLFSKPVIKGKYFRSRKFWNSAGIARNAMQSTKKGIFIYCLALPKEWDRRKYKRD